MAILDVPFIYTATGKLPRDRNVTALSLVGMTPVKLPEVSGDQAPVVGRCRYQTTRPVTDQDRHREGRLAAVACEAETDYRLIDGRLMRRAVLDFPGFFGARSGDRVVAPLRVHSHIGPAVRAAMDADTPAPVTADLAQSAMFLLAAAVTRGSQGLMLRLPGDPAPRKADCLEADCPFNRREGDDRRLRAAEVGRAMAGAAFVDGVLYLPSWGPGWSMATDTARQCQLATAIPELGHASHYLDWVFQAGQEDGARTVALIGAEDEETPYPVVFEGAAVMDDGAAFPLPPDELAIRDLLVKLSDDMGDSFLEARNPRLLRAFADVMEAAQDLDGDASSALPALRELADHWRVFCGEEDTRVWVCKSVDILCARVETRQATPETLPAAGLIR